MTHVSCNTGYFFQRWLQGKDQRLDLSLCSVKWVQKVTGVGGDKLPTLNHSPPHHTVSSQWSFPLHNSVPCNCTTSGEGTSPTGWGWSRKGRAGDWSATPIFLPFSAHCPNCWETPYWGSEPLNSYSDSSLDLDILSWRAILAEGARCSSSAAWLILKLEVEVIFSEWVL